jgi:hypothetical protein
VPSGKPITLTVQRDENCDNFLKPADPALLGDLSNAKGGIEANVFGVGSVTRVLVTLRGATPAPVTVTGLTFEAVKEIPGGLAGTIEGPQCGGETIGRYAEVDLDNKPSPKIVASSNQVAGWGDESYRTTPIGFPYTVTNADSENILIVAHTKNYVAWRARLAWTDGQQVGEETIDLHGEPFQTSMPANSELSSTQAPSEQGD